jgi:hypothetical protein
LVKSEGMWHTMHKVKNAKKNSRADVIYMYNREIESNSTVKIQKKQR